jgi:N-acetyl-1-D-myo-inositol-2-amino-2-deoxy-alpha-D-glucopyranoside deacetylase
MPRDGHHGVIESILRTPGAGVVVVAPHPDDESIAAGGLIQNAIANGASVSVVFVTDGDNNPWPQRVAERRVIIGAGERERWGRRRREESVAALKILGVDGASIRRLSFRDLGVTDRLVSDPGTSVRVMRDTFTELAPRLIVAPGLTDRHPDHGAVHVMCRLALGAAGSHATLLSYMVHGSAGANHDGYEHDARMHANKQRAVGAYETQLALSRKRIMAYSARPERFAMEASSTRDPVRAVERLPWRIGRIAAACANLILVADGRAWTIAVETGDASADATATPSCTRDGSGQLWLRIPAALGVSSPVFVKLAARFTSPWIFDHWGWARIGGSPPE